MLLTSSLLNALYFLPIVARAFFPVSPAAPAGRAEAPLTMLLAIGVAVLGTIGLFFYPHFLFDLLSPLTAR